jgi:pimeloyl-ACP methyl ester carboxylesterase
MAIGTGVQDRKVTLNGLRFHYLDWGNEDAQPLVLLHGLSSHAHTWDKFASAMQPEFHVLALDQRGHGETDWASDYSRKRRAEDVDAFVTALGLQKIALVGLSMGGRAAYMYTAAHPEAVERLVIVDIGPEAPTSGMQRIQAGMQAPDVFDDPEQAFQAARVANPRPSDEDLQYRLRFGLKQRDDGKWTFRFDPAQRTITPVDPAAGWALMPTITCPTLVIRGSDSDVLSRETAERMAREIPTCTLVEVTNSGHSVPLDNPDGFLAAARPFLAQPGR